MNNFPKNPTSEDWTILLQETGIDFKFGLSRAHWNVLPISNFKSWTDEECSILENKIKEMGYKFSYDLVKMVNNKYLERYTVTRGKGLRIL